MFPSIPTHVSATTESLCARFLSFFSPDTDITLQSITLPHNNKQHQLANWYYKEKHEKIIEKWCEENKNEKYFEERLVILRSDGSLASQWLDALPNHSLDQTMPNLSYRTALQFRYSIPMLEEGICLNCNQEGDPYGFHAAKCRGLHNRHQVLVKAVTAALNMGNFHAKMDANVRCLGINHDGNLRPADILADGEGNNGSQDCIDVTIVSNMCKNAPRPFIPGKAALDADKKKCIKHSSACELAGYGFKPFATDICGILSPSSHLFLNRIASSYACISNRMYSYALNICKRRISFAIQKGLARQLITSPNFSPSLMEDPYEAI
jgi:hypothetical protein